MIAKANYTEPCICGDSLDQVIVDNVWRIVSWKCPTCGKQIASTMISDSPVASSYALKKMLVMSNTTLRKDKGLSPKRTIVTFTDENTDKKILWSEIENENKKWEKRVKFVQRKAF